jgi:surface protein
MGASRFNSDISGWNVGNVRDMSYMFRGEQIFNSDIKQCHIYPYMFQNATSFNADISNWPLYGTTVYVTRLVWTEYYKLRKVSPPNLYYRPGNRLLGLQILVLR